MTVVFDALARKLCLTQSSFERLISQDVDDALRQAGVVTDDGPHPAIAPAVMAVTEAVCRLNIDLFDGRTGPKSGDGWVARHGAALLLDTTDETRDFIGLPASLLPAALARLVQLGPRPRLGTEALSIGNGLYRELQSGRQGELSQDGPFADLLASGRWRFWTATMSWRDHRAQPASMSIQVLDTEIDWWLCTPTRDGAVLTPTNATRIWRLLTLLLPDDVEPVSALKLFRSCCPAV